MSITAVPNTYSELHTLYRPYAEKMVRKWGVRQHEDIEDITSVIMTKFIERDMLVEYDPSRNVLFSTYLGGFIGAYVRYMAHKKRVDRDREGVSYDIAWEDHHSTYFDIITPTHYDNLDHVEYDEFIAGCRRHLAAVPRINKNDRIDMVRVFDILIEQVDAEGKINISELGRELGVSLGTAKNWMARVREQITCYRERLAA